MRKQDIPQPSSTRASRGYEKVRLAVEEYIRTHGLQPGDRIPTEAEFCRQLGWSRPTITRALNEMAGEGFLVRVQGRGTFVAQPERTTPYTIMVSTPWTGSGSYVDPLFRGIRQQSASHSVNVIYYSESAVPSPEIVSEYGVDGVLAVAPWLDSVQAIKELQEASIPVVALALRSRVGRLSAVCTDNYGGMYEAVKYLCEMGHRRIAYVSLGINTCDVFERLLGFQKALTEYNLDVDPAYLLMSSADISQSYFESWMENLATQPTAMLFGINMAIPVLRMLAKKHLRVPEDMSLIVTDDPSAEWGMAQTLTCVHQPIYEMGRRGVEKLIGIIEGSELGYQEVIPTQLIVRGSTAPARVADTGVKRETVASSPVE
jgi:DNA-binding LacI/PurR family transcriptional regulator